MDFIDAVCGFCAAHSVGLCNMFVSHATAELAIVETGVGSDDDLIDMLERLLPRDGCYRHTHGSVSHGPDHSYCRGPGKASF